MIFLRSGRVIFLISSGKFPAACCEEVHFPAIPAGNSDLDSPEEGIESDVPSRESGDNPAVELVLEEVKFGSESTKGPALSGSTSESSAPAGIAVHFQTS